MAVPDGQEPNLDAIRARLESEETDGIVPAYFKDVPALLAALAQLQADLDAAENTSQMHERSWHLAEAALAQLQVDHEAEIARLANKPGGVIRRYGWISATEAAQLRAERDAAVEAAKEIAETAAIYKADTL